MMNLSEILTDELTDIREEARANKNYTLSDQIRNELDSRGSFCFDNPEGQEVYHLGKEWNRNQVIKYREFIDKSFETNKAFRI
jgi:hypothetical protein